MYNEVIDKEHRIANRLIKAAIKTKESSLYEIYLDINHDTIDSVKNYFEQYFVEEQGIPKETPQNKLETVDSLHVSKLLPKMFFSQPEQYEKSWYFANSSKQRTLDQIRSNVELFNLMVPFRMSRKMAFNKFYYVDCEELSFLTISHLLGKDYINTFHGRFKGAPEYPFGELEQNT